MSGRSLGSLTVDLILKMGGFTEGMKGASRQTKASMREIQKAVDESAKRVKQFAAAGAAAILAGFAMTAALVNSSRQSIDAQAKLARSLSGTTDGLRALKIAASDSGMDNLESSLNRMNQRLGAVEMQSGPALEAVKALNLDLNAMASMDVDEKLAHIADGIRDYGGTAQESAQHLKRLGFEQESAIELFRNGGDAIRAARNEVKDYGLSLSEIDARKVEMANDAISRMKLAQEGVVQQLTVGLSPVLVAMAEQWNEYSRAAVASGRPVEDIIDRFIIGGINTASAFRSGGIAVKNMVSDLWDGFQNLPPWAQEVGVAGAIIGGRKGVMVLAGISYALKDLQTNVEWFKMYQEGAIDLQALVNTSPDDARRIMEQLGRDVGNTEVEGPSIIASLFGAPSGAESQQWADDWVSRYRAMKEEVNQRAAALNDDYQSVSPIGDLLASDLVDPAQNEALDKRLALYTQSEQSLHRQLALFKDNSEMAALMYEMEHGALVELNPMEKERLWYMQSQLDAMREVALAEKDREEGTRESAEDFTKNMTLMDEFAMQAARNMQDSFAQFLFDPFDKGLKGMVGGFINTMRQLVAETASQQILKALFTGLANSSSPFMAGIGAMFGGVPFVGPMPSRDSGGRGAPGQAYMIGMGAQPEVFIPDQAGTFIPNADRIGGGLTINMAIDARDEGAESRIRSMIQQEVFPQFLAAARGSTIAALKRPRFA